MVSKDALLAVSRSLSGDLQSARGLVDEIRERRRAEDARAIRRQASAPAGPPIFGARPPAPQPMPAMKPDAKLTLRLPNGKVNVVHVARHRDLVSVARANDANARLAFAAITHNGRAIDRLASSHVALTERVDELQPEGELGLLRGMVEGLAGLESRLRQVERAQRHALAAPSRSTRKQLAWLKREVENHARNAGAQKLQGTVATLQSIAMSTEGELLSRENVLLAINQLGWNFGAQALRATGGGAAAGVASLLELLAPLGNLATSKAVIGKGFAGKGDGGG